MFSLHGCLIYIVLAILPSFPAARYHFWPDIEKRSISSDVGIQQNEISDSESSERDDPTSNSSSMWFCCQLNKEGDRCVKEIRSYPVGAFVPKGMKCWQNEVPPLSYVVFLKNYPNGKNRRFRA